MIFMINHMLVLQNFHPLVSEEDKNGSDLLKMSDFNNISEIVSFIDFNNKSSLSFSPADVSLIGETIVQGSIFEEKEMIGAGGKLDNNANDGDIHDLLLETIIKDNIEYADKRSKGGCLWVALSSSDEEYIEKLRDFGAEFKFAKCSSALGYRDGWWTQDIINTTRPIIC